MAESNTNIFVSAVLPADGVTVLSDPIIVEDKPFISLYCKYTRGGIGGSVIIKIDYSYDGTNFYQAGHLEQDVVSPGAAALGSDIQRVIQREQYEYEATDDPLESFTFWVTNFNNPAKVNAKSIQLRLKEEGNLANPGTFECWLRLKDNT